MSSSKRPAAIETSEETSDPGRALADQVIAALAEVKAVNAVVLDVRGKTPLTDYLVIASGNSARHLATMKQAVLRLADGRRRRALGVEGDSESDWLLIDLADCVVHLMRPTARVFYDLERLWSVGPEPEPAAN